MKRAVLIHGFHLQSQLQIGGVSYDWHDLVMGQLDLGLLNGRATYGVGIAFAIQANAVIFSTGASERDGLKEAEYTYQAVLAKSRLIARCLDVTDDWFCNWLMPLVRLDIESRTTAEELQRNLIWCDEQGMHDVTLVTSRFHAPRALSNANDARRALGLHNLRIRALAPEDPTPAPVIFEPPTRPDRPSHNWHEALAGIFLIPADLQALALEKIKAIIAEYKL